MCNYHSYVMNRTRICANCFWNFIVEVGVPTTTNLFRKRRDTQMVADKVAICVNRCVICVNPRLISNIAYNTKP